MRLSLMLFPFHEIFENAVKSPEQFLKEMKQAGITALEPLIMWVNEQPHHWREIQRVAADLGLSLACADVFVDFVGHRPSDRRAAIDTAVRAVEQCAQMECPLVLIVGTKPATGMSGTEGRKIYGEGLARVAEQTKGTGVTLTIEDFGMTPDFVCNAAQMREVLSAAGDAGIQVVFDTGNFLFADEKPLDNLPPLRDRIVHVHVKDLAPAVDGQKVLLNSKGGVPYVGCGLGAGRAQVGECLARLKEYRYQGYLSLEVGATPAFESAIKDAQYVLQRDLSFFP